MPYRVDIPHPASDILDELLEMGAIDVEQGYHGVAALLPDSVPRQVVECTWGSSGVHISDAVARDSGSVWILSPRAFRVGDLVIAPPETAPGPGILRLADSAAFGTGRHATTTLCVEALEEILKYEQTDSILDVGTGSGILALAALMLGVQKAVGLDIEEAALVAAGENARLNGLGERIHLAFGGPGTLSGLWPLVVANVLAAPLMDMAPVLTRRVGRQGQLLLSGIPGSLESEVRVVYQHFGMRHLRTTTRDGWAMLLMRAPW